MKGEQVVVRLGRLWPCFSSGEFCNTEANRHLQADDSGISCCDCRYLARMKVESAVFKEEIEIQQIQELSAQKSMGAR